MALGGWNRRYYDGAQTEIGSIPLGTLVSATKPIIEQTAWRLFDDNAAIGAGTALGTENVAFQRDLVVWADKQYQLRVQLTNRDASVAVTTPLLTLQRRYNGGPWEPVTNTTSGVVWGISSFLTTGDVAAASRLTAPGGMTYIAGFGVEGVGSITSPVSIPTTRFTEVVWVIKQTTAVITPGDVIDLRIVRDDSAGYMTFTQIATMQVVLSGVIATSAQSWGTWTAAATGKIDKNLITVTAIQWCLDTASPDTAPFTGDTDGRITVPLAVNQWQLRMQWRHDGPGFQDASTFILQCRTFTPGASAWADIAVGPGGYGTSANYSNNFFMGNVPARCGDIDAALYQGSGRAASGTATTTGNLSQGMYNEYVWCVKHYNTSPLNALGYYAEYRIKRVLETDNIVYQAGIPTLMLGVWNVPINVVATATGQTTISLTWTAVTAARGYDIERDGVVIATNYPASPYNDTGLVANTGYNYRVIAVG